MTVNQGDVAAEQCDPAVGRQPLGLGSVEVHHHDDNGRTVRIGAQDANAARLDQPLEGCGRRCDHRLPLARQTGPVVGDKAGAKGHHRQRQRRFATAGPTQNKHTLAIKGNTGGMQNGAVSRLVVGGPGRHTGRPTTKRAPNGSEVGSASVGRMFSAQITPPCASTICLEMARPSPE